MRIFACAIVLALAFGATPAFADEPERKAPELSDIKVDPMVRAPQSQGADRSAEVNKGGLPWNLVDLNVGKAWNRSKGGVRVCVVDTGIDSNNIKLGSRIQAGYNALAKDADYSDSDGQGTGVAGVIVSVAPQAKLYVAKVSDSSNDADGISPAAVAAGILWCIEQDASLINLSLTLSAAAVGRDNGNAVEKAVKLAYSKGFLVITGASSKNAMTKYQDVISVSASNFRGKSAEGGSESQASFAAPGVDIITTSPGGRDMARSGSAFAAPHITGLAALYAAVNPGARPSDIRAALTRAITRVWIPEADQRDGRVDAARLVSDH